ncbi:MAG TPA: hypothetical protein VH330_00190 [Candidatus Udaeobacter sp.]
MSSVVAAVSAAIGVADAGGTPAATVEDAGDSESRLVSPERAARERKGSAAKSIQ